MKRQYPMKFSRASNRLRTCRRQPSSGLTLEGCHSTSSEPQSVIPHHYGRWCLHCLIIVWWSTTSFRSYSNQGPQGSPDRAYMARIPRTVLSEILKIRPMAAAFIPATEVPTTRRRWASVVLIAVVWRKHCHSNATDDRNLRATAS